MSRRRHGLLITFEGIDGSGKTTQATLLHRELSSKGLALVQTREPGGTRLGEELRRMLLSSMAAPFQAAELFLYLADRAQHVAEVIRPAVDSGLIVISDRYVDSTAAFQGYGRGLPLGLIEEMNKLATGGLLPDLTILLDLDVELARERLRSRDAAGTTRFERESHEFHLRVRAGYLELARQNPERMRVVDASGSAEETHAKVMALVESCLMTS
jgi:dTMP kinase